VRQLAAAFLPASLLAGVSSERILPSQQAAWGQSGSKLPHSKALLRMPTGERFFATSLPDGDITRQRLCLAQFNRSNSLSLRKICLQARVVADF
jgi:hypothetical protein